MSVGPDCESCESLGACDLEDMVEMAESIDEFLGAPVVGSPRPAAFGPAIPGGNGELGRPIGSFAMVRTGLDALRPPFVVVRPTLSLAKNTRR
jgi:hypothetical protein